MKRTPPLCSAETQPRPHLGRDKDQQSEGKAPFQSDRADKCRVEEQKGGAWLCAWLSGTHTPTPMHSHSLSLPPTAPPVPPQLIGGPLSPFVQVLLSGAWPFTSGTLRPS